jgi:tight adherence protein C
MGQMIADAEKERNEAQKTKMRLVAVDNTTVDHRTMAEMSFKERVIQPIISGLEARLMQFAPQELRNMMEQMLFRLGVQEQWSVKRLAAGWVISVSLGFLLAMLIVYKSDLQFSQQVALLALGVTAGAVVPFMALQSAIRQRKAQLRRQLPEFLDFLCVSVQAGLSFDGAVAKIASRMKGPLIDEFRRMLRDMSLGMTRQRTLTQLAKRCDLEEIYLFTSSVIQAEHLGTSMSKTLKTQADNMRDRHRQAVRTAAMQAPIKIIFPMVFFIFPSIFVMVVFPAALSLLKSLGK